MGRFFQFFSPLTMSLESFEENRAKAFKDTKKNGWSYLQFLEQQSISRPRDVVSLGKKLLENDWISSGNRWRLLERVVICSLEIHDTTTARECIMKQRTTSRKQRSSTLSFWTQKMIPIT